MESLSIARAKSAVDSENEWQRRGGRRL